MVILHHGGIAFAQIRNDDDFDQILNSSDMTRFVYTQMHLPSEICKVYSIACYSRQDFLELLNSWNASSPNHWQYFESK